jgi:hypothetical protein
MKGIYITGIDRFQILKTAAGSIKIFTINGAFKDG